MEAPILSKKLIPLSITNGTFRDVIDVAVGMSSVIVASIEPDKIGKIIDASSSVKEMFKTTKQALLGTNIAVVIPNFVAKKHNEYVQSYPQYFTGNIDHYISSYAKTLQDEYFKATVTLHISPLTHKGLNLVSYIRRLSENQSLMIVDPKGNIVEFSKDLSLPLNLYAKKGFLKIEALCPDFKKINQAFALLYKSDNSENNNDPEYEETRLQSPKFMTPKGSDLMPLTSLANQRLLSSSDFYKSFRNTERYLSNDKMTTESVTDNMTIEEAREIWENSKEMKELSFYPFDGQQEIKYETEIEPYFLNPKWYKIVKVKSPASSQTKHKISVPQYIPEEPDGFADVFPSADERTHDEGDEMTDSKAKSQSPHSLVKNQVSISVDKRSLSNTFHSFVKLPNSDSHDHPGQAIMKKFSHQKAKSIESRVTSQASQKMAAKRLKASIGIEKQSASSKLVITMVYFSVVAILCSISVNLLKTKDSLTEMQSDISLTRIVNTRLAKTILNWQSMLVLYSRAVKLTLSLRHFQKKFFT